MWCDSTIFNYYSQAVVVAKPFDLRYFWAREKGFGELCDFNSSLWSSKTLFCWTNAFIDLLAGFEGFQSKKQGTNPQISGKTVIFLFSKISFFTWKKTTLWPYEFSTKVVWLKVSSFHKKIETSKNFNSKHIYT